MAKHHEKSTKRFFNKRQKLKFDSFPTSNKNTSKKISHKFPSTPQPYFAAATPQPRTTAGSFTPSPQSQPSAKGGDSRQQQQQQQQQQLPPVAPGDKPARCEQIRVAAPKTAANVMPQEGLINAVEGN
jgi:hypothetical protein